MSEFFIKTRFIAEITIMVIVAVTSALAGKFTEALLATMIALLWYNMHIIQGNFEILRDEIHKLKAGDE